jgi:methylenetetrahydrofolate reductase (NADPH)
MVLLGSDRRAARRSVRRVVELDAGGRQRLRALLTNSCLVVEPTTSVVELVGSRLAPGSVTVGVASNASLGIDQTVAVTEILAARGYDVRPHLSAALIEGPRHLARITRRLLRCRSVLLVPGSDDSAPDGEVPDLAAAIAGTAGAPRVGMLVPAVAGDRHAERVLAAAASADWISTGVSLDTRPVIGWVAQMRVRGLETPIELGVPGVVRFDALARRYPEAVTETGGRRRPQWHEPTALVSSIAEEQALERLAITGLRIDTLNFVDETAGWRQRLFDLAAPGRGI